MVNFSHPYVWAPFSLLGFAEFCIQPYFGDEVKQEEHQHINFDNLGLDDLLEAISMND